MEANGKSFNTGMTSIVFSKGDLHYSIQKMNIQVIGTKEGANWHMNVHISDVYDFTEYRTGGGFSNFANNIGYKLQKGNIITPYKWDIYFEIDSHLLLT